MSVNRSKARTVPSLSIKGGAWCVPRWLAQALFILLTLVLMPGLMSLGTAADLPRESMIRDLKQWVSERLSIPPELVEVAPMDARLRVPDCPKALNFDFPFPVHDQVRVRCEGQGADLYIRIIVIEPRNTVLAAKALSAGQVVTSTDLILQPVAKPQPGTLESLGLAVGRYLKKPVGPGAWILSSDLEEAELVMRLKADIKRGSTLSKGQFETLSMPKSLAPPGFLSAKQSYEGMRLKLDLSAGHILSTDDLTLERDVWVARENLLPGQLLDLNRLQLLPIRIQGPLTGYYTDLSGLDNAEMVREVRQGEPLKVGDVRPELLVRRGAEVMLTMNSNGQVQITLRVEALDDARMGESIKMKNLESGRILFGTVTGKNMAKSR